jgi:hypothetical protein
MTWLTSLVATAVLAIVALSALYPQPICSGSVRLQATELSWRPPETFGSRTILSSSVMTQAGSTFAWSVPPTWQRTATEILILVTGQVGEFAGEREASLADLRTSEVAH